MHSYAPQPDWPGTLRYSLAFLDVCMAAGFPAGLRAIKGRRYDSQSLYIRIWHLEGESVIRVSDHRRHPDAMFDPSRGPTFMDVDVNREGLSAAVRRLERALRTIHVPSDGQAARRLPAAFVGRVEAA